MMWAWRANVGALAIGVTSGNFSAEELAPLADVVLDSVRDLPAWLWRRIVPSGRLCEVSSRFDREAQLREEGARLVVEGPEVDTDARRAVLFQQRIDVLDECPAYAAAPVPRVD